MSFLDKVNLLAPPSFELGQQVFIPTPRGVEKTVIKGLNLKVVSDYTQDPPILVAVVRDYETTRIHPDISFNWRETELFADQASAEVAAKFTEVSLDDADWNELLGMQPDGSRVYESTVDSLVTLDSCALPLCCATISEVRDLFFSCWQQHGLMAFQLTRLSSLFNAHEAPDPHPILTNVLTQLNLSWNPSSEE